MNQKKISYKKTEFEVIQFQINNLEVNFSITIQIEFSFNPIQIQKFSIFFYKLIYIGTNTKFNSLNFWKRLKTQVFTLMILWLFSKLRDRQLTKT